MIARNYDLAGHTNSATSLRRAATELTRLQGELDYMTECNQTNKDAADSLQSRIQKLEEALGKVAMPHTPYSQFQLRQIARTALAREGDET
jgi:hypothetical protein